MAFELDAVEQRVLGSLLEKQVTVPGSYPMSLNALRTACNQSSSRDPVTDYDDRTLLDCLRGLITNELVGTQWSGRGSRVLKYTQTLVDRLVVSSDERALLTVLLLRGPQAPGELKTRTERLHPFADRADVEACLAGLAERPDPLVLELERVAGQHDRRWVHLLGEVELPAAPLAEQPTVDRESVLQNGPQARDALVRQAWDAVAAEYAEEFAEELDDKPLERWLLDEIVELVGDAPVLDVGCGPGHVAGYLIDAGATVTGLDLSEQMIEIARERAPGGTFVVGNQVNLLRPPAAHSWGAIVSFYSTLHLAASELPPLLAEFGRVLDDDGRLLLAVRPGQQVIGSAAFAAHGVELDVVLHDPEQVLDAVRAAGFVDVQWYKRGPLAGETDAERFFVTARRPR